MPLPFTADQFHGVFRTYNETVWPAQWGLSGLALAILFFAARPRPWSGAAISGALAVLWSWMAFAYHLAFFAAINPLAYAFAAVSAAGAGAFFWYGTIRRRLAFRIRFRGCGAAGVALVLFALLGYPAWSVLAGRAYRELPTFGLPCPTTLFTIGVLACAVPPMPKPVLAVPVLWCLVGAQAAFLLGVPEDLGLLAAAALGLAMLLRTGKALP